MTAITVQFPEHIFASLRLSPDEFTRELRLAAAIHWYQRGAVSQERAAEIAGLDRTDFLLALASEKVDVFAVNLDELRAEVERG